MKRTKFDNRITHKWIPCGNYPEPKKGEPLQMRQMQAEAFDVLTSHPNVILNAPTASGKTMAITWGISDQLKREPSLKAIVAVPQTIIGEGFQEYNFLSFNDKKDPFKWAPQHKLCTPSIDSNVKQIFEFLNKPRSKRDVNDRILICSHASLTKAFCDYKEEFKDLIICIDEAHHIQYSETDQDDENETLFQSATNQMGKLVKYALDEPPKNIKLWLSTATLFRGDKMQVIPSQHMSKFERYHYPMDKYLDQCQYLKSFKYDIALYDHQWKKTLSDMLSKRMNEGKGKAIIYLPSVNSQYYSYGSKDRDKQEIYKAIARNDDPVIEVSDNGLTRVKRGKKWINIIDLVDDGSIRDKRKQLIHDAHNYKDNSQIDVIISLNMFREGANWKWADTAFIIGAKGSLTDMTQIFGRPLRDAKDKEDVYIGQLLPYSFDTLEKDEFRKQLNDYSKVIFSSMIIEDIICPVSLNVPVSKKDKDNNKPKTKNKPEDYIRNVISDESKIFKIWEEIRNACVNLQGLGTVDFSQNTDETRETFRDIVKDSLIGNGIDEYHFEIAEQIRKRWMLESMKQSQELSGLDITKIDFDAIQVNPLDFIKGFTSDKFGVKNFNELRNAINKGYLPLEEAQELSLQFADQYMQVYNKRAGSERYKDWIRGNITHEKIDKPKEGMPLEPLKVYNNV